PPRRAAAQAGDPPEGLDPAQAAVPDGRDRGDGVHPRQDEVLEEQPRFLRHDAQRWLRSDRGQALRPVRRRSKADARLARNSREALRWTSKEPPLGGFSHFSYTPRFSAVDKCAARGSVAGGTAARI